MDINQSGAEVSTWAAADLFEPDAVFVVTEASAACPSPNAPAGDTLLAAFRAHRRQRPRTPHHQLVRLGNTPRDPYALIEKGFAIFGYAPFPIQPPVNWAANPFKDRSWCYHLNTLELLDSVIAAYDRQEDRRLLTFAVDVVRDWLRQNWSATEESNPFAWYDMAVGLRATKLAWLIDAACAADVDDEALGDLLRGAVRHIKELRNPQNLAKATNHGLFQMLGLLSLTRGYPELRGAPEAQVYAEEQVERMLTEHFCEPEGIHLEHSPTYHRYLTDLLHIALSTGLVSTPRLEALRSKAYDALAWMIRPDGALTRLGDCDYEPRIVAPDILAPELRPRHPGLWHVLTRGREGRPPATGALFLPRSGYAFIRGSWPQTPEAWEKASYLSFSAAFHSRAHKQADEGSFEWAEAGQMLVVDAGSYGYHYELPERQYCESTRAHNTLEIDGADYSRKRADAFGSALRRWTQTGSTYALEAEFRRPGKLHHRRLLVYTPARWLLVIDQIEAPQPHTYTQWLHFAPELELLSEGRRVVLSLPAGDRQLWVRSLSQPADSEIRTVRGQREPRLEGWISLAYKQLTPNWALACTARAANALLATLLLLTPTRQSLADETLHMARAAAELELAWSVEDQSAGVRVRHGAGLEVDVWGPGADA